MFGTVQRIEPTKTRTYVIYVEKEGWNNIAVRTHTQQRPWYGCVRQNNMMRMEEELFPKRRVPFILIQ